MVLKLIICFLKYYLIKIVKNFEDILKKVVKLFDLI